MPWTYPLNSTKASKLALEILLVGLVAQARHDERLERVATDIGIISGIVCRGVWGQQRADRS